MKNRGIYLATALQALSHLRHSSAHAFMCWSLGKASHTFAQLSQHLAQQSAMTADNGPPLAQFLEQAVQQFAQSRQYIRHERCSFLPSASKFAQCVVQRSHAR